MYRCVELPIWHLFYCWCAETAYNKAHTQGEKLIHFVLAHCRISTHALQIASLVHKTHSLVNIKHANSPPRANKKCRNKHTRCAFSPAHQKRKTFLLRIRARLSFRLFRNAREERASLEICILTSLVVCCKFRLAEHTTRDARGLTANANPFSILLMHM